MKDTHTNRGFALSNFIDKYDHKCSLQESSIATEACIWLGIDEPDPIIMGTRVDGEGTGWVKYPLHEDVHINTRMHLTQAMVAELLPYLNRFVETGYLHEETK